MKYLIYPDLPTVPEELLEHPDSIISRPYDKEHPPASVVNFFETRRVSKQLDEWVRDHVKADCAVQYQIINSHIVPHRDIRRKMACNYLLQKGGEDATICFFDQEKVFQESYPMLERVWHILKTDEFHTVTGVTGIRVALSICFDRFGWDQGFKE